MKKVLMMVLITALAFINSLGATDFAKKGVWELGGSIRFTSTAIVFRGETYEDSMNRLTLDVPVYYFVMDGLELGLVPSLDSMSYSGSTSKVFGVYLAPAWNFKLKGNIFPFIEGRIGYNSYDPSDVNGFAWAILSGVKVKVGGNVLINTGLGYLQRTLEGENHTGGRSGDNTFFLQAGFSIIFGK